MEEEMLSVISNGEVSVIADVSDSNSSSTPPFPANKHVNYGSTIYSSNFKGVVPQQNGHWGAQIYANHQRIWLGTFKSENEAALAYDSAAIRLRSGDSHRNFPWTNISVEEPNFQSHYSAEMVLNMIRDGSYQSKFADFLRTRSPEFVLNPVKVHSNGGLILKQLFQKELTPSDVSKLNRLVIPKKYAVKYFPPISESVEGDVEDGKVNDVQLVFYDMSMRLWKFRYCYWSSSQSFVFTRGWNRFVKEKELKANDTITFYITECRENGKEARAFCIIDVHKGENNNGTVDMSDQCVGVQPDLRLQLEPDSLHNENEKRRVEVGESMKEGFKLFGVQII